MTVVTSFKVTSAAQLNAAIAAISLGGTAEASNTAYTITVLSDLTLNAVITSINLGAGSSLSIIGADPGNAGLVAPINGDGTRRGFSVTSGTVSLINLDLVGMHATSGGAAISVANGATVTTTGVNFSADHATRAGGGGILVQQGGALTLDGGRVAGSGTGDAIFLQAGSTITLENGVDVTGPIADMAGAGLGGGAGSVAIIGGVTLAAGNPYTGATVIGPGGATGTLSLQAPGAAGSGTIGFGDAFGDQLIVSSGDLPINVITGFTIGDTIDLQGIGLETAGTIGPGNRLALQGGTLPATLALDPDADYTSNAVVLQSDGATGTRLTMVQNRFSIASEADWNAALSQIDLGGVSSGIDTAYTLALTQSFTLGADMLAIDLAAGDMLTIAGDGQTIDGGNLYRGLFDDVGAVAIDDLTIRDAVATGGAGGSGAAPGGGGGGLGGGLFVAAGGTATLTEVVFSNDQAVGGAGGAYRGSGVGGGGGLGGAGGAGSGIHAGGGGGVGLGATGGSYPASNGGAGILAGAGAGGAGEGAGSGGGGANGGGGGAGGTFSGSGRDPRSFPGPSGSGGSENFGGGAGSGSAAGFGGGGAAYNGAANGSPDPNSGTGGWGGGGAGGGAGGFGAGTSTGGGGGLGAGGAVFVQQGGELVFGGGALSGGAATGGAGTGGSGNGAGLGSGIFAQGGGDLDFAPAGGQTLTVSDVIADQGAGAPPEGLLLNGLGTVALTAANRFSGATTIDSGTMLLGNAMAAGGGNIIFAYGASASLEIGAGDVPANLIDGFLPGITIDLAGIGVATAATLLPGNTLAVTGGSVAVALALDPAQIFTGESFAVQDDGSGGSFVFAETAGNDHPPSIAGAPAVVTGDDHTPLSPLAGVTISDLDIGQSETASLTLSTLANGALSNFGSGTYDAVTGVYTVVGSAAAVTGALQGLVFTPVDHEVVPGATVQTGFALAVTDGVMAAAAADTVAVTALDDAPVIAGTGSWLDGYFTVPINLFTGVTVTDPDAGALETVTVTFSNSGPWSSPTDANGTLSGAGVTKTGVGTYSIAGTPDAVTAALQASQFTPEPLATPGFVITGASLSVSDGIAPPTIAQWSALSAGLPVFTGTRGGQTVAANATTDPFATVTITDSPGLDIEGLTVTLQDATGTATDADGTLSGSGITEVGTGIYDLAIQNPATGDSPALITSEVDQLVFTPTPTSVGATTTLVLSAFDGATTSDNYDTTVTATAPVAATAVTSISDVAPGSDLDAGKTVAITLHTNGIAAVKGTPTLTLDDGGTATYVSGSGTDALVFNTTIKAGQNAAALAVTAVKLPGKAAITGAGGRKLDLTEAIGALPTPVQVDTTAPTIASVTADPAFGTFGTGAIVTLAANFSEAVTVGGSAKPTLKLNDGGVATYIGGSGSDVLTFGYTVAAGQSTASLEPTALAVPRGTTITDLAGNSAVLAGARTTLGGIISINIAALALASHTMRFIGGSSTPAAAALPGVSDVLAQAASNSQSLAGLFGSSGSISTPAPSIAAVFGGMLLPTSIGAPFSLLATDQTNSIAF